MERREFLKTVGALGASQAFAAPKPLDRVRIGVVGLGARGSAHVDELLRLQGVLLTAFADVYAPAAEASAARCIAAGRPRPALYTEGDRAYRALLERDDVDAALIATPWRWHTPMAVDAMNAGKHVFIEVPAAVTLDECWELVETQERTGVHCMMLENVCYGREELMVLNMCRLGLFGELTHGEAAYIHDLREQMNDVERGTGSWRTPEQTTRNGNLYPTHGLGPIAQYMGVNRGDRFDYLVSMSSAARGRALYAREHFPPDHPRNQVTYVCGDMNSSLIRTEKGRTILLQWDETTPRPYSRLNLIQGTRGIFAGYPDRIASEGRGPTHEWQDLEAYRREFEHPLWLEVGAEAERVGGGHGGMDFVMLWRVVHCLREGISLDQDVYDAASWSAISPLSERSVANRSLPVDVPDFTRGRYKTREPLQVARASESRRFLESLPATNQAITNERKIPS
jgi:predicted dehydrogenase